MNKWIKLASLSLLSTTLIACSKPAVVDEADVDDNDKEIVNIYVDYGHEVETRVVDDEESADSGSGNNSNDIFTGEETYIDENGDTVKMNKGESSSSESSSVSFTLGEADKEHKELSTQEYIDTLHEGGFESVFGDVDHHYDYIESDNIIQIYLDEEFKREHVELYEVSQDDHKFAVAFYGFDALRHHDAINATFEILVDGTDEKLFAFDGEGSVVYDFLSK